MSSVDNKENLFDVYVDIDTPINIEVKHQISSTVIKPGDKYPMLFKGMTRKDFSSWNRSHLQKLLVDRGINKTGNKDTLITNAYNAYKVNLEISAIDCTKEKNEVQPNLQSELVLGNGLESLPDPSKLIDERFAVPSILPKTTYEQVNT